MLKASQSLHTDALHKKDHPPNRPDLSTPLRNLAQKFKSNGQYDPFEFLLEGLI